MSIRRSWLCLVLVLFVTCLASSTVNAGQPFGFRWWTAKNSVPRPRYSPLHYWAPQWYFLKACVRPTQYSQYTPTSEAPYVIEDEEMAAEALPPPTNGELLPEPIPFPQQAPQP